MNLENGLDIEDARASLATSSFWHEIIYLERVGSTNEVAKSLAAQGAPTGTVVVAEEQTEGRGRLNRRWIAPARSSLLCSLLFRPSLRPEQATQLTMLCSLAAADAVNQIAGLSVELKWPNDLIVVSHSREGDPQPWRKLAGVLTESAVVDATLEFVVVGIGINVNVPEDRVVKLAPNATSIVAETGDEVNRARLLISFLNRVRTRYNRLEGGEDLRQEWSSRLVTLGRRVRVRTTEGVLSGLAEDVDEDGALLLRTDEGVLRRLLAGDVTLTRDHTL